jgi:hypothetical protein
MEFKFNLPTRLPKIVILTDMMKEMINRTLSVHALSPLVLWYGQARVGKTTTALYMKEELNRLFVEDDPNTFRAAHYVVGKVKSGNDWKRAIGSFYKETLGYNMDKGFYVSNTPEALARQTVHSLRRKHIQLVFVDEAGTLSLEALRGINLIRDIAENDDWTLTIVFVGMDDLPDKLIKIPQIHKRVLETCHFTEYGIDDTRMFLKKLHPHFEKLNPKNKAHQEQVKTVHELCGGLPGLIVSFIHKLNYRLQSVTDEVDAVFLRAIYELSNQSMISALKESRRRYSPYEVVPRSETPVKPRPQKPKGSSRSGKKAKNS